MSNIRKSSFKELKRLLGKQPVSAGYDDVRNVALKFYKGINTPVALALHSALARGDVDIIANASVNPGDYSTADSFALDYAATAFLKKYEDLPKLGKTELNPGRAAMESFFASEAKCASTNQRLQQFLSCSAMPTEDIVHVLNRARILIQTYLPAVPSVEEFTIAFGPGATSACTKDHVTMADKLVAFPELTWDSRHLVDVLKNSPTWISMLQAVHPSLFIGGRRTVDDFGNLVHLDYKLAPRLVRGNRFTTVPKTAKTDRGICIEPHTLAILQKSVGTVLSKVLEKLGLSKVHQQVVNGRFAQQASLNGEFATVDLSAASDTVALELVKLLFPWDWFCFLTSLRCQETWIDGRWVELEKFSSMGNGFTFELETIVFYALCRSISDLCYGENVSPVCVFGDDIIFGSDCMQLATEVFDFCGFSINHEKTFHGTSFNESCGQDFFKGTFVRPYFLKETPIYASDWYAVANGIRCLGCKPGFDWVFDPRFLGAWLRVISRIPNQLRFYGPQGYGDNWIHDADTRNWKIRRNCRHGIEFHTGSIRGIRPVPRNRSLERYSSNVQYACALMGASSIGFSLRGDPHRMASTWFDVVV